MNKVYRKGFVEKVVLIAVIVVAGVTCVAVRTPMVRDMLAGMGYEPSEKMATMIEEVGLTNKGERILRATRPSLEGKSEFNTHCQNGSEETSLLGCYAGGKIYVFEVTAEELAKANRVTLAHELLHAAWGRMSGGERERVQKWLDEVYEQKRDWFEEELVAYNEEQKIEEIYTRVGTKVRDLPEELEKHYAEYFENRGKIVDYYEEYEAPFLGLKVELGQLAAKIEKVRGEIDAGKEEYTARVKTLDAEIDEFNSCANRAGCFSDQGVFNARREELMAQKASLEEMRNELNGKITENNARIVEYQERAGELAELNEAMDSRIVTPIEAVK